MQRSLQKRRTTPYKQYDMCAHVLYVLELRGKKYSETRPRPRERQYLHVTPRLCRRPKNMTLIFIGLQNTIYYLIKCTVRTEDGNNCVLYALL